MNQKNIDYLKQQVEFHCMESYKYLIFNLENLDLTIKQQKVIKDSFDTLNLNLQLELDDLKKNNYESK